MNLSDFQKLSLVDIQNNLRGINQFLHYVKALELQSRDDLILTHNCIQHVTETAKEIEKQLRIKAVNVCFPDSKDKGTKTLKLGAGWSVRAKFTKTYKVEADTIKDSLAKVVQQFHLAGEAAIEGLVKYEPKLSEKVYDTLSDEIKAIVDESLTIKPGTPAFELLSPKEQNT